jgi:hypothetical protein
MTSALYTALAILGLIAAGLILFAIAWAVLSFERIVDFVAKLFEQEAREFANADRFVCGDVPALHEELTGGRNLLSVPGGQGTTELPTTRRTHNTHSVLLSGPLSGTGTL